MTIRPIPIIALKGINVADNLCRLASIAGTLPNTSVNNNKPPKILTTLKSKLLLKVRIAKTTSAPPIIVWNGANLPAILLKKLVPPFPFIECG